MPGGKARHTAARVLEIAGMSVAGILLIVVLAIGFLTFWLTPERLSRVINTELSEYLNADIQADSVEYRIWSTFPHLTITTGRITVRSRSLDSLPPGIRNRLPADASFLASATSFGGEINLVDLLSNRIMLRNLHVSDLRLNLVDVNDSVSNYAILPTDGPKLDHVPYLSTDSLNVSNSAKISYYSAASGLSAVLDLNSLRLVRTGLSQPLSRHHENSYTLVMGGNVSATADNIRFLKDFPFDMNGDIALAFNPFSISMTDYGFDLGNLDGKLTMSLGVGDDPSISRFTYSLSTVNLMKLFDYLPDDLVPDLAAISAELPVEASAKLLSSWNFSPDSLPTLDISFRIPEGDIRYSLLNTRLRDNPRGIRDISATHSPISGNFMFNGSNPAASKVSLEPFHISSNGLDVRIAALSYTLDDPQLTVDTEISAGNISRTLAALPVNLPVRASGSLHAEGTAGLYFGNVADNFIPHSIEGFSLNSNLTLGDFSLDYPADSMHIEGGSLNIRYAMNPGRKPTLSGAGSLAISGADLGYAGPQGKAELDRLATAVNFARRRAPRPLPMPLVSRRNTTDSLLPHTPEYLIVATPAILRDAISCYDYTVSASVNGLSAKLPDSHTTTSLRSLDLALSPDSLRISDLDMTCLSTPVRLSANVAGLADFLRDSINPRPLDIELDTKLGVVNINSLAHAFFMAHGGLPAEKPDLRPEASDSVAFLLPRNLTAHIRAAARETVYTNLHLYDLSTDVHLADGIAAVDTLSISSDFGRAGLSLLYDSSDIDRLSFGADVSLTQIDIVNFFKNFHTLLLMMPQMENLSGMLSLHLSGGGMLFPDMVVSVPSLYADADLHGRQLVVKQDKFIRRVTRMMLIRSDAPLHIANMDVSLDIHDNLLQLNPFHFQFPGYKLTMLGINNFNGRLYYHIAVDHNPLHIPFGIQVEGMFHHPTLRFGGTHYDYRRGLGVTSSIQEQNNVNLVAMMKKFVQAFLRKAAQAAEDPTLSL